MKVNLFWFRRDLRLEDNVGLQAALTSGLPVVPLFIFDPNILSGLAKDDPRVSFIYQRLKEMTVELGAYQTAIQILHGDPLEVFKELNTHYDINEVYANKDYEPLAIKRDEGIANYLQEEGQKIVLFKDQVIFEEKDILKSDGTPYTVFTPYKRRWREKLAKTDWQGAPTTNLNNFHKLGQSSLSLAELGFEQSSIIIEPFKLDILDDYAVTRDYPTKETSYLSPHLRFGTTSIRQVLASTFRKNDHFVDELIWREFFMQILFNFPHVVERSFKPKYDRINWLNDESQFHKWTKGETGYPIVDAGMRELNTTGYMHGRSRMIAASFLCKHLLIDWRWGEAYFAEKLLDYELSSNNGNWQWSAGSGCDAAPYFRIFSPDAQQKKFDKHYQYIKKWIPEFGSPQYPQPIIDHKFARARALETYSAALNQIE